MTRPRRPSERENSTPNPLPLGPLAGGGNAPDERGTILAVDARRHTYRVATNTGRDLRVGRLKAHPNDNALLPARTPVMISWSAGIPYIVGCLPTEVETVTDDEPHSVTDVDGHGGNDPVLTNSMGIDARDPSQPRDILPGDNVLLSPDGASVGALQGKIAQLRGGPLAKVQAFGEDDVVKIIAGLLHVVTWMGESKVVNNDGKTSFIWRGGTDQLTQTGPDEQKHTIRLDVGYTGDVIRLEVCDRLGHALFRFHVSSTGVCELFAAGGLNQQSGAAESQEHPVRFHGARVTEIAGAERSQVSGAVEHTYQSSRTYVVDGDASDTIGGTERRAIGGNASLEVTGDYAQRTGGKITTTTVGAVTHSSSGAYSVKTLGATITLDPGPGQTVIATAAGVPDRIKLGSGAVSHAVKFEELSATVATLAARLTVVHGLVAAHFHTAFGPGAGVSVPLAPLTQAVLIDMSAAKATQTLVG